MERIAVPNVPLTTAARKAPAPSGADALRRARVDPDSGEALWEEQCFYRPPLAAERVAVPDRYFKDISTEELEGGAGWARLRGLSPLWD